MKSNFKFKNVVIYLLIALFLIIGSVIVYDSLNKTDKLVWSDVVDMFENRQVTRFELDNDGNLAFEAKIIAKNSDGTDKRDENGKLVFATDANGNYQKKTYSYRIGNSEQLKYISDMALELQKEGVIEKFDFTPPKNTPVIVQYIPYIIIFIVIIVFWIYMMNQATGKGGKMNSFSRSHAKTSQNDKNAVKFADVAGAEEEKGELEEIVEFLKDPTKFTRLGAKIPHGVLLVGPPGTGKTLLAKAVAGEAGVPFYSISGSDFVEMYVGVGASRVRDLFDTARKNPASIIFIDEIDAVGRQRGTGLGGGHDEREQTLNQLLVEMDGFGGHEGIIVIAATNRPDVLDPALLRPGRFDRQVTVNYPDIKGREEILKVHIRNKPIEGSVDLHKVAQTTVGFTGADLANLMNEAALLAAKRNKNLIGMKDIEDSYMKVILGPQKKSKMRTEHDNKLTAFHEAGHAIAAYYAPHADPVKHITIIPAGQAGGVTLMVPEQDKMTSSRNEMLDRIVVDLGGRVAEELTMDDISTGASNDIQQATKLARNMVMRYGMSDMLGTVLWGSEHSDSEVFLGRDFNSAKNYSEKTASEIDDEIRRIIAQAHNRCRTYLKEHMDKLEFVANYLLKYEYMDGDIFEMAMSGDYTMDDLAAIYDQRKKKSDEENADAAKLDERIERMMENREHEIMNRRNHISDGGVSQSNKTDSSDDDHGDDNNSAGDKNSADNDSTEK